MNAWQDFMIGRGENTNAGRRYKETSSSLEARSNQDVIEQAERDQ